MANALPQFYGDGTWSSISYPYQIINQETSSFKIIGDIGQFIHWDVDYNLFQTFRVFPNPVLGVGFDNATSKILIKDEQGNILHTITGISSTTGAFPDILINIESPQIIIDYYFEGSWVTEGQPVEFSGGLRYYLSFVKNRYPLKKWTITDVILRACDLIEPLRFGEKPRFRFEGVNYDDNSGNPTTYNSGSQAEEFDKIMSPEFAFTKMTFREQMQKVGGFIHGEFRITRIVYENNRPVFYFKFDKYGGTEKIPDNARIKGNYVYAGFNIDINDYCTDLDSSAENLINQLDWAQGVIIDPFNGGYITPRTESTTARLQDDDSTVIPTVKPIHHFGENGKLYCYIPETGQEVDITPYLFEKADYDLLSAYDGTYPYARAYALYYEIGQNNIKGLFYKSPHAISGIFSRYAIVNILRAVTGNDSLFDVGDTKTLLELRFKIVYIPIFDERIKTNKAVIINGLPRSIAYNQSANLIESRYYGEHLKGVVARMGNISKTYTYNLAFLSDVPKVGMMFDDEYYISTVSTEFLPDRIKCTIGLSKDFNRLSQYVGVNSEMRMWEISERQAVSRDTIITEYLVLSKNKILSDSGVFYKVVPSEVFNANLDQIVAAQRLPISAVQVVRVKKDASSVLSPNITLPVIAVANGNSMLLTFSFNDNFSAGQRVQWVDGEQGTGNNHGVSGYWANYIQYSDYYGRFYYLDFVFLAGTMTYNSGDAQTFPMATVQNAVYPIGDSGILDNTPTSGNFVKYQKDSREVPQISYSLTAVSSDSDLIIGSGLMRNCHYINQSPKSIYLAFFSENISNVSSLPNMSSKVAGLSGTITFSADATSYFIELAKSGNAEYKSWAILTVGDTQNIIVSDDNGEPTVQSITSGNELIIGGNGILPEKIYMAVKKKIYA